MQEDRLAINKQTIDFIKTLEIRDVLLVESEHNVNSLFLDKNTNLGVDLSHSEDNEIKVLDGYVIFEMSLSLLIYNNEDRHEDIEPVLKSAAKFAAIYSYNSEMFNDEDDIEGFAINFFRFSAGTHIIAFARKYFYDMVNNSGYPRVFIPLIKSALDDDAEQAASEHLINNQNN